MTAAFLFRQHRLWGDLGALTGQIAAVRAGELARPLELPRDHDLSQAADDLNHIQQGLQAAMEERTRSERMKVELVTNVSHDLKTPLTSIISYAELLEQEHLEPPAGEYVTILSQKAQRLKGMVQDVFEVSKAASGQLPVSLKQLDLARLLRQTLADMDQPIQESGLQLRTQLPDHSVLIQGDSDRLYRVFQNLLGNALKYSLAGSRVYLTLTVEEGQAVAALRNTSAAELRPGLDYTQRFVRGLCVVFLAVCGVCSRRHSIFYKGSHAIGAGFSAPAFTAPRCTPARIRGGGRCRGGAARGGAGPCRARG